MNTAPLLPGKLPVTLLAELLRQVSPTDPRVLVGPRVGEDAAVIDMGDHLLIAKSDPITFATDAIGYYAVTVNANAAVVPNSGFGGVDVKVIAGAIVSTSQVYVAGKDVLPAGSVPLTENV